MVRFGLERVFLTAEVVFEAGRGVLRVGSEGKAWEKDLIVRFPSRFGREGFRLGGLGAYLARQGAVW